MVEILGLVIIVMLIIIINSRLKISSLVKQFNNVSEQLESDLEKSVEELTDLKATNNRLIKEIEILNQPKPKTTRKVKEKVVEEKEVKETKKKK